MSTDNEFASGKISLSVDIPGLKTSLEVAKDLAHTAVRDLNKLKLDVGGGGAAEATLSGSDRQSRNEAKARRLRRQSLIEERAIAKEFGRPITRQIRLDAREYRRKLKDLAKDTKLSPQRVDIELHTTEKIHRNHLRKSVRALKAPPSPPGMGAGLNNMFGRSMVGSRIGALGAAGPAGLALDGSVAAGGAAIAAYSAVSSKIATDGLQRLAMVEKYRNSLRVVLRDQAKANDLFAELEALDIKLPVGLDTLANSAQQLAGAGFDPAKISGYVESIANAGALSVDGLTEGVSRITRALTQIKSKGKLEMEDLNQIAELGIPIRQIIKEQFGMTADQLRDLISDGVMTMDQAIQGIFSGFDENYAGALESQGNTLLGQVDRLRDAYQRFAGEASEPLFDSLQYALENVISLLNDGGLDGAMDPFVDGINTAAGAVVILGANLENIVGAIEKSFPKLSALLTIAGAKGVDLSEQGKQILDAERQKKQLDAQRDALDARRKQREEQERRDALSPEDRAAEDAIAASAAQADKDRTDFTTAQEEYVQRTGETYSGGGLGSADADKFIAEYRDRQSFQPVMDAANKDGKTSFSYDDFTEAQRQKMRERAAKDARAKEAEGAEAKMAMARGMTVEEYRTSRLKGQQGLATQGAGAALGLLGKGLSAAKGALGGVIPDFDRITGGAASAVGGAFTLDNQTKFDLAKKEFEKIRSDELFRMRFAQGGMMWDNIAPTEEMKALAATQLDMKGFVDEKGNLKIDFDIEKQQLRDLSTQAVGFGDLNRAIQERIDQAKQIKLQEEVAENTKKMAEKMQKFIDLMLGGGNKAPKFTMGP